MVHGMRQSRAGLPGVGFPGAVGPGQCVMQTFCDGPLSCQLAQGGSTVNTATSTRAMLLVAFFGAGALAVHAGGNSCIDCHTNAATMQKLVVPPSGESAEGEG